MTRSLLVVTMLLTTLLPSLVWGQAYPTKVITIIVPFSAGGILVVVSPAILRLREEAFQE